MLCRGYRAAILGLFEHCFRPSVGFLLPINQGFLPKEHVAFAGAASTTIASRFDRNREQLSLSDLLPLLEAAARGSGCGGSELSQALMCLKECPP
jgi:hypothetical protein